LALPARVNSDEGRKGNAVLLPRRRTLKLPASETHTAPARSTMAAQGVLRAFDHTPSKKGVVVAAVPPMVDTTRPGVTTRMSMFPLSAT
jgi:hypothetical protein